MRRVKSLVYSKPTIRVYDDQSSTSSSEQMTVYSHQDHARPKSKADYFLTSSNSDSNTSVSRHTINSSINRFRSDFDEMKCKMRIFSESLNLCRCIADDFQLKLNSMERRLEKLEKKHVVRRSESNYSAIIQKNKKLSNKTFKEVKKLQMCGTEDEMREVAARICKNYLHGAWKTVEPTSLSFRRISGGLSNFLYYIALPDDSTKLVGYTGRDSSPDAEAVPLPASITGTRRSSSFTGEEPTQVLLRIYGQVHGERAMDAIVTESVIFTLLSERRLGPKLHGVFSGGRIEEYIPARCLLVKELSDPSISMKIAEKTAAIHSMAVPLSKEPNFLWKNMAKWLKAVKEEKLSGSYQPKNEEESRIIKELKSIDFDAEIEWLKKYLESIDSISVFCHNDLQEGNILILEDSPLGILTDDNGSEHEPSAQYIPAFDNDDKFSSDDNNTRDSILSRVSDSGEPRLVLIDFEYCAYNHRGFDIANHFQEWRYDYTNPEYPFYYELEENIATLEQKEIFIKQYLKHYALNMTEERQVAPPTVDEVNKLLHEVEAFALASHLFWSLWSFVNASKSQIPFGYWEYGYGRFHIYKRLKHQAIKENSGKSLKRKIHEVDI